MTIRAELLICGEGKLEFLSKSAKVDYCIYLEQAQNLLEPLLLPFRNGLHFCKAKLKRRWSIQNLGGEIMYAIFSQIGRRSIAKCSIGLKWQERRSLGTSPPHVHVSMMKAEVYNYLGRNFLYCPHSIARNEGNMAESCYLDYQYQVPMTTVSQSHRQSQ